MPVARPGATDALAAFDGVWIGPARMTTPDGQTIRFEQMERIGPMLAGEIRVMEGQARGAAGERLFNALTVFSLGEGGIEMRSHTPGHVETRLVEMTDDGFVWRTRTGDNEMVYTVSIRDGVWHETGVVRRPDGREFPFFEMTLNRVGDTDWPSANPAFPVADQ